LNTPILFLDRLSREVQNESSLLYTRQRDIHAVGIVLLQMLMGLDVMERFPDAQTAIHACRFNFFGIVIHLLIVSICSASISALLARLALNMLQPYRKNLVTCISLLSELSEGTSRTQSISRTIPSPSGMSSTPDFFLASDMFEFFKMLDHRYSCTSVLLILIISGCQG